QLANDLVERTQQEVDQANRQANQFKADAKQVYDDARLLQAGARADKRGAEKALLNARQILYSLQLREVMATVAAGDHNQGLALLEDAERCPPNLRDFTWRYYHRWCKRDRLTLPVGAGLSLAVSPDGGTFAVGGPGGVRLYDLASGRLRATLERA